MLLMIDNYDSFTYNLVQYFGELGEEVRVYRNDEITLAEIERCKPDRIVISPGPCTPNEAGVSVPLITTLCRQASRCSACASATRASARPSAARSCMPSSDARQDLGDPSRRHRRVSRPAESVHRDALPLAGDRARKPAGCLEITAWTDDGEIMGVRHKTLRWKACSSIPNPS
jgi:anthranilate synthase component II